MSLKILDLAVATTNQGKFKELKAKLTPFGMTLYPMSEFGDFDIEETGLTFVENAILKARVLSQIAKMPTLADDSGLVVEALGGAPGIYSARYAGPNAADAENYKKLLHEMREIPESFRQAYTYCALVLMLHENDPAPHIFTGQMDCQILTEPRGEHGFGYDPVIYVPALKSSLGELPIEIKNQISHRAKAMDQLLAALAVLRADH